MKHKWVWSYIYLKHSHDYIGSKYIWVHESNSLHKWVWSYIYLKHSHDYIGSKYIWVHESNSLGSGFFSEIPFLAFLALHSKRKRCGQVGPSPCYSQSEVIYAYQVLYLLLQGFFWPNTYLAISHYHGNHFQLDQNLSSH